MKVTEWENTANLVAKWVIYYQPNSVLEFNLCLKTEYCPGGK